MSGLTNKKKLIIAAVVVVAIASIAGYSVVARNRGVVAVQSGRVVRQDLTQTVSANGEIKPKKYVNVSSNMRGRIVRLPVKEGDRVKRGQLLATLEKRTQSCERPSSNAESLVSWCAKIPRKGSVPSAIRTWKNLFRGSP